jgi:hypothetical protein
MKWEDYKETWKDEWAFYKRNPEFPLLMLLFIGLSIYYILKETLCKN